MHFHCESSNGKTTYVKEVYKNVKTVADMGSKAHNDFQVKGLRSRTSYIL